MEKKVRVFIDVDNTIFNTDQRMVDRLNKEFDLDYKVRGCKHYKDYATLYGVNDEVIRKHFCAEDFYDSTHLFRDVTEELNKLIGFAEVVFYTNGTSVNNARKLLFLADRFPHIEVITDSFPVTDGKKVAKEKSNVKTRGTIFIDDSKAVLDSTDASHKILFRGNYTTSDQLMWGGTDRRYVVTEWEDIADLVKQIIEKM